MMPHEAAGRSRGFLVASRRRRKLLYILGWNFSLGA